MLEVKLLGQFEVLRDGKRLIIPTRNAQSLLAYLILNAGIVHRRERLAGLLWPDSSEENARSNLRHELWRLRKAVEVDRESHLLVDDLAIAFNAQSAYSLDVQMLESIHLEGSSTNELIQALSTYHGELLPGFYDEWVFVERERLHALFEAKIARLLELLQSEGRWTEVIDWGMRWISLGGWPEPAYRALMTAYASSGDMSKAMTTYERYSHVLLKEMGIKPSEQTQALYKRLKSGWRMTVPKDTPTRSIQPPQSSLDIASPLFPIPKGRRSNLPRPLTSFIGREKEMRQVERLVSQVRLVTITGAGGVGKTRLAIEAAGTLTPLFEDGAWWVELASLFVTTPSPKRYLSDQPGLPEMQEPSILTAGQAESAGAELVAQAIAKALRIPESPGLPHLEGVLEHLNDKELLLVLDNCEHLIGACAILVERVLGDCPNVVILATSREALGVPGEIAWLLPSLSLPGRGQSTDFASIIQSEAVTLFIERAAGALPGYDLGEVEAPTIAQICLRLDGIPLAIELAAARMNLLSTQEIAARLDRRFSLLTAGHRTALPRHQTLLAAIEWSYDLLSNLEQALFRRLSIFAESFTLEAAEAICGGDPIKPDKVLTLLGRLVDKSLLNVEPAHQDPDFPTRYRFLDTICSFGHLKLEEADETRWMRNERARYFLRLVETAEPELTGPNQLFWLNRLKEEHNNIRAVLQWSLDIDDTETALKLVGALWRYWWMQSHHNEGREWLGKTLSMNMPQPPSLRAKALNGAGILARGQGDFETASTFLVECLEIQRSLADKNGIANALNSLGLLAHLQGDYTKATNHYQASIDYRRETGDKRGMAATLHNLSMINQEKGEFVQAGELLNESLAVFVELNDVRSIAVTQIYLGYLKYETGDAMQSENYLRKSLVALKNLGGRNDIIECLEGFAGVAALLKKPQRGASLLAAAQALREVIGIPVARYLQIRYQHIVESVTSQLEPQELEIYRAEGRGMSMDEAIEYALSPDDTPIVRQMTGLFSTDVSANTH